MSIFANNTYEQFKKELDKATKDKNKMYDIIVCEK